MAIYYNGTRVTERGANFTAYKIYKTFAVGGRETLFSTDIPIGNPEGFSRPFYNFFLTIDFYELPREYFGTAWVSDNYGNLYPSSNIIEDHKVSISGMIGDNRPLETLTVHVDLTSFYLLGEAMVRAEGCVQFLEQ